ncbi:MAG: hypothetical protein ACYCZ0_03710 [Minisyncoccota bacterium]
MEPTTVQEPGANLTMPMLIGGALIAIAVLAGLYLWQRPQVADETLSDVDSETWMPASSDSDDATAIQAELEATSMTQFEQNMNADAAAAASGL